jgi:FAD binding domain
LFTPARAAMSPTRAPLMPWAENSATAASMSRRLLRSAPMTPAAGAGANTALRDAAGLVRALVPAREGTALTDALAAYGTEMIRYGTEIVAESLRNAERMFSARASS